jgi:hypothetical protein
MQPDSSKARFRNEVLKSLPDVLLPNQSFKSPRVQTFSSEQRLMLAVLTDAINVMGDSRDSASPLKRDSFAEASGWVFSKGVEGPMSFDHVCDALDVDADVLRKRLSELVSGHGISLLRLRLKQASRALPVTVNRIRRRRRSARTFLRTKFYR